MIIEPIRPQQKRTDIIDRLKKIVDKRYRKAISETKSPILSTDVDFPITHSLVRRILLKYRRTYPVWRNLEGYEDLFKRHNLPGLCDLISEKLIRSKNKRIKFLDAGAGEGNLKDDLYKRFNQEVISYSGVDMIEHRNPDGSVKVNHFDLMYNRLPNNFYDFIVAGFSFPYLTDKLKALENMINALKVNGILVIPGFGELKINGMDVPVIPKMYTNEFTDAKRNYLLSILKKSNHFLDIDITPEGGIIIKKIKQGVAKIPFKFLGATIKLDNIHEKLNANITLGQIKSHYSRVIN